MKINLVEICRIKYPGQIEAMNIMFRQPEDEILFAMWNVPDIEQPKESDLLAQSDDYQHIYDMNCLKTQGDAIIVPLLDATAQSRQYTNAMSCISYASSSNDSWKAEALAFIVWRDNVYAYSINILNDVASGKIVAPTSEQFSSGIPLMVWPN